MTNLLTANQSTMETSGSAWTAADSNTTLNWTTARAYDGTHCEQMVASAAGTISAYCTTDIAVTAFGQYTISAYFYNGLSSSTAFFELDWRDSGHNYIGYSSSYTSATTIVASTWTKATFTASAPSGASFVTIICGATVAGSGQKVYFDLVDFEAISSTNPSPQGIGTLENVGNVSIVVTDGSGNISLSPNGIITAETFSGVAVSGNTALPVGIYSNETFDQTGGLTVLGGVPATPPTPAPTYILSSYMPYVSSTFATAIRQTFTATVKADVYYAGQYVATVPVADGQITVDRTADNVRQGTITIADPSFFPTFVNSPLAPFGAELHISYGLQYITGKIEWIPLGVFVIDTVNAEDAVDATTGSLLGDAPVVSFFDRSKIIQWAQFRTPISRGGWDVKALLNSLIVNVCPSAKVIWDPSITGSKRVPGGTIFDTDRWGAVQTCAGYFGAEGRFGWDGNFYVVPIPTLQAKVISGAVPAWTFNAGSNGVLIEAERGVTREGVGNYVSVQGSATGSGATPYGGAWDADPRSPTYWGGDSAPNLSIFGANVIRLSNSLLTTQAEVNSYAQAQLGNYLGLARSLSFTSLPNPALDGGDLIEVVYKGGQSELHILDSYTLSFSVDQSRSAGIAFTGRTRTLTYQLSAGQ
jgi:hypothetical protein